MAERLDRILDKLPFYARTRVVPMLAALLSMAIVQFVMGPAPAGSAVYQLGLAAAAALLGLLLFHLREAQLRVYAILEISAGVFACFTAANKLLPLRSADSPAWLTALGAVYLMVRGLDNWRRGEDRRLASK